MTVAAFKAEGARQEVTVREDTDLRSRHATIVKALGSRWQ